MVGIVSAALAATVGNKGLLTFPRLIGDMARQTVPADENQVNLLISDWPGDSLLFESRSVGLNYENNRGVLQRHEARSVPSPEQSKFWEEFNTDLVDGRVVTTGQRLASLRKLKIDIIAKESMAGQSRNWSMSRTNSEWVIHFDDDDVMHPERVHFTKDAVREYPEIELLMTATSMVKASPEMYEPIRDWYNARYSSVDLPSVNWKQVIELSDLVPTGQCKDAPNSPVEHPKPVKAGRDHRYERWQGNYYHLDKKVPEPSCEKISISLKKPDPTANLRGGTNQPSQCLKYTDGVNYPFGWLTIERGLWNRLPFEDRYDEGVFYGWHSVASQCAKMQMFAVELGLYMKPRLWEY